MGEMCSKFTQYVVSQHLCTNNSSLHKSMLFLILCNADVSGNASFFLILEKFLFYLGKCSYGPF